VWRHRSVLALVTAHGHETDPVLVIRERAKEVLAHTRSMGWSGPPFDPRVLASCLGIKVRMELLGPERDAYIYPLNATELEIVYDPTRPASRQNFSICHEVSHTLFPDGYEMVRNRSRARERFDPDRELEYLCDVAAAELLLPETEFMDDVERYGFGLDSVAILRERYQASRQAVILRMVQLDRGQSAAVFLEERLKPSEIAGRKQLPLIGDPIEPAPKLRIAYAVPSPAFAVFLPEHKSIPDDSCAYRAVEGSDVEKAREAWSIPGLPECEVEAMVMPAGDAPDASVRAVAVLRLG
jgi:hypothetical protein